MSRDLPGYHGYVKRARGGTSERYGQNRDGHHPDFHKCEAPIVFPPSVPFKLQSKQSAQSLGTGNWGRVWAVYAISLQKRSARSTLLMLRV